MGRLPNVGASEAIMKTACGHCKPVYRMNNEAIWSDDLDMKKELFTHMTKKGVMKYHYACVSLFQVYEYLQSMDL